MTDAMTDAFTSDELALLDRIAAETVSPVAPPPAIRASILDAIRSVPQLDTSLPGQHESRTVRADEGTWKTIIPGVQVKKLSVDRERGTVTMLMQLAPKTVLPPHDHHGPEDSYVLAGSCHIGAVGLMTGDFHHVDTTAHHGHVVAGAEGCTLLLVVSREDAA